MDPAAVAQFLRSCPGLNKQTTGELLGEYDEFFLEVLRHFTDTFDFTGNGHGTGHGNGNGDCHGNGDDNNGRNKNNNNDMLFGYDELGMCTGSLVSSEQYVCASL